MNNLKNISMAHLMALRDLGRDELRRARQHVEELEGQICDIMMEIENRERSKSE